MSLILRWHKASPPSYRHLLPFTRRKAESPSSSTKAPRQTFIPTKSPVRHCHHLRPLCLTVLPTRVQVRAPRALHCFAPWQSQPSPVLARFLHFAASAYSEEEVRDHVAHHLLVGTAGKVRSQEAKHLLPLQAAVRLLGRSGYQKIVTTMPSRPSRRRCPVPCFPAKILQASQASYLPPPTSLIDRPCPLLSLPRRRPPTSTRPRLLFPGTSQRPCRFPMEHGALAQLQAWKRSSSTRSAGNSNGKVRLPTVVHQTSRTEYRRLCTKALGLRVVR